MPCPQCGNEVSEKDKYCSSCGAQLSPSAANNGKIDQVIKKKKMPLWFKILFVLSIAALMGVTAGILFTESLVDVIDNQLKSLRKSNIEDAYYNYTSEEFQKATPLEEFNEFINDYPIFKNNESAHFTQRSLKNNLGILKGNITTLDHTKIPIEYRLIKEHGKWKILSIRLLKPENLKTLSSNKNEIEALKTVISNQLSDIKSGKINEAYEKYSSKDFKESTSQNSFIEFSHRYPILTKFDSYEFSSTSARKDIGIVSLVLHMNDVVSFLKYYLIQEQNGWKIWSMRILSPLEENNETKDETTEITPRATENEMQIMGMILGSEINENGSIKTPTSHLKINTGNIYLNVTVKNGRQDETFNIKLQNIESHAFILAKATIEEPGDSVLLTTFSPPAEGWVKGDYQMVVTTSSGQTKTVKFSIE